MTTNEAQQQRWSDTVEQLRQRFNLTDQEVITIKEWGVALLLTGVSAWVLYRIVRTILGFNSKKVVKVKVKAAEQKVTEQRAPKAKRRRAKVPYASSPWFPLIKRYAGPLVVALMRKQVVRYLRANHIIR